MNRPWQVWSMFGVCLAVAIAGMAWLSHRVVGLERADAMQTFQADFEGNVRLALRRMDSQISELVNGQNVVPYQAYQPTYRPPSTGKLPAALIESPLRSPGSPLIKIYFELGPGHELRSPSVAADAGQSSKPSQWATFDSMPLRRLQELKQILDPAVLLAHCPPAQPWSSEQFNDLPPTNTASTPAAPWQGPINVNPPPLVPLQDQQAQLLRIRPAIWPLRLKGGKCTTTAITATVPSPFRPRPNLLPRGHPPPAPTLVKRRHAAPRRSPRRRD
ncbi:MAG: hypothetical protein K8T25_08255 [Planctomycetia bacterium]|nr:hypothetical protein [Planctomycetia bacterium]